MDTQETTLSYGGFWARLGATLVDSILVMILFTFPMSLYYGDSYWDGEQTFAGVLDFLVTFVLPVTIVIFMWVKISATPGKMALNLIVVDADTGAKLTTKQAIIRYLGYIVSFIPLGLGFLWVAFDKKKRGWHDMMANTVVIKKPPENVSFKGE